MCAVIEGVKAFEDNVDLDDNPYDESRPEHDEWDDGWSLTLWGFKFCDETTKPVNHKPT